MKRVFKLSLLANVLLAALVCYLETSPPAQSPFSPHEANLAPPQPPVPTSDSYGNPAAPRQTTPLEFDWRQLEAADYPTYIANLRAIKCPEQTVRDIISADLAGLFAAKRKELRLDNPASGPWSREEETNVIASLFAQPANAADYSLPPATAARLEAVTATMPLVFQTQALAALNLNDEQREGLDELTREFIQQVGGPGQDPNDPTYLERWRKAQPEIDRKLTDVIGRRALVDLDQVLPHPEADDE